MRDVINSNQKKRRSLNNRGESAAFMLSSANGLTLWSSGWRTLGPTSQLWDIKGSPTHYLQGVVPGIPVLSMVYDGWEGKCSNGVTH